ncbi:imidazole glycerol phosphate synthase subunit HisH [Pilimelia terevasa]|uniref:Imidazole glycerol phosphate synthase subunit HisH n=1 Tax=Pilimelia terevasa TaxID=53372 RepID=A0A8J3BRN8_9ACTN|nr:imidazole glycerol phosphate synthase subunit HisH [Pilimelia terevasa]
MPDTAPRVVVLDYGSGNLRSAERALAAAGAAVAVTADLAAAATADGLVVPGVGAFAACMAGLEALGAGPVIAARVAAGRPVLGICVGAQVMFDGGAEHGVDTPGLGLLPGTVTRLAAARVPHMGWNTVRVPAGSRLGARDGDRFYFVHSYAAQDLGALRATGALVTTGTHDVPFAAAVEWGALTVTQFHPEKSAGTGAALLRAWTAGLPAAIPTAPAPAP